MMDLINRQLAKYPRDPVLFVDESNVLRRCVRRQTGALVIHEMFPVVGIIDAGIWEVAFNERAWKLAPEERP
jgi:hypothetical protein